MPETPTVRTHLMALADLLDEPNRLVGPDAERCTAAAVGELRWVWARLVNKFVEAVESDA
ncbi:hypothetical protein PP568_17365 [Mycobacteroides abscessus]|nr:MULTISPECIES: hypothetical protein [Mycobacteriaceae]MBN7434273.1 hypothetical protein [Mycobacteroides abscessus subsp. abscessus]MBN7458786.1 hypothetical protein [Mycobacteroides abscessus subsp. abscessus]MBN7557487.1 hypothetical protein [Mycobacteroides abscessus subsp. abscessus]MDM2406982.1 hypothetical protein [Mycobacteroides abscessus]MDM2416409.1 hypothetical protein [Mycobacteroides abscessus]